MYALTSNIIIIEILFIIIFLKNQVKLLTISGSSRIQNKELALGNKEGEGTELTKSESF